MPCISPVALGEAGPTLRDPGPASVLGVLGAVPDPRRLGRLSGLAMWSRWDLPAVMWWSPVGKGPDREGASCRRPWAHSPQWEVTQSGLFLQQWKAAMCVRLLPREAPGAHCGQPHGRPLSLRHRKDGPYHLGNCGSSRNPGSQMSAGQQAFLRMLVLGLLH